MSFARPKYPHPRSIDHLLFDAGSVYLHGFEEATSWADEYKRILKLFESNLK